MLKLRIVPTAPAASVVAPAAANNALTGLPPYLMVRQGVYYFKRKIPAAVTRTLKLTSKQVWKSLETTEFAVALKRLAVELREFDALVASANDKVGTRGKKVVLLPLRGQGTTKYLLPEHIPYVLGRFGFFHLNTDDELRREYDRDERAELVKFYDEALHDLYDQAASEDFTGIEDLANVLLQVERLIAPPGSEVRQELLKELLAKEIEVMEVQRDRLKGRMTRTPKPPLAPRDLPTLLSLFQGWRKTQSEVRTIETYEGFVEKFEGLLGALPVLAITRDHATAFVEDLASRKLSRDTVQNHIGGLSTLVRFGCREQLCLLDRNPFEDIGVDAIPERPASDARRAYEASELIQLFTSPLYTQGQRTEGQAAESCYWAPLLGPFVGARLEEVCQLRVEDVQCINGVWALRIANLDADQHLKTDSSYRWVPLHEEVIKCGFLAHVAGMKRAGHERVFPSQSNENKYKRWGNAFGKWYGAYLDTIGLDDERIGYHSFRFSFKQRCTMSGIENEVRDALTGHWYSKKDAGRGYMRTTDRQYPFPALVDAMKKLKYAELDLSHLYVAAPPMAMEAFG